MKHIFLFCLLVLQTLMARADYTPFVVEGKTWIMESQNGGSTSVVSWTSVLSGDTLINNTLYKKLNEKFRWIDGSVSDEYFGAFREEGHKVYVVKAGSTEEQLHYDFNLQVGDIFSGYKVCLNDTFKNYGRTLHRIGLAFPTYESVVVDVDMSNFWIEGIGGKWGPELSIYFTLTGGETKIRYCYVGDDYLYKDSLQEFVSPKLAWADGYTKDNTIYLNLHKATCMRDVDGQTYTVMQSRQYAATSEGDVLEGESVEYLLRENLEGEVWLRMEKPQQMADSGYQVVLATANHMYFDFAYCRHHEEKGLDWGGFTDEYRAFDWEPLAHANVIGMNAQLWTEPIRSFRQVEWQLYPKMFGLAERSWNNRSALTLPEFTSLVYHYMLPKLHQEGHNFHLQLPGIHVANDTVYMNTVVGGQTADSRIEYTLDGGETWQTYTEPFVLNKDVLPVVTDDYGTARVIKARWQYLNHWSNTTWLWIE